MHKDPTHLSLLTLRGRWEIPLQDLLLHAIDGTLRLSMSAEKLDLAHDERARTDAWVHLSTSDVQSCLSQDRVLVRRVFSRQEEMNLPEPIACSWADLFISKKDQIAFERAVNFLPGSSSLDAILQTDHPNYSTELATAVRAWVAICHNSEADSSPLTTKQRIRRWLKKHYPDTFNDTQVERIETLVNPDKEKKGGVRKNPRSS